MSERFIIENNDHYWIRDAERAEYISHGVACDRLNRLAGQVETLRELLKELRQCTDRTAWNKALLKNIDAALADTETPG